MKLHQWKRAYFKKIKKETIPREVKNNMTSIFKVAALAAVFTALACADSFSGRLLDAACVDQQKSASCDPSASTVSFALSVSGKNYKLDDAGNAKAVEAMKARSESAKGAGGAAASATVNAKVNGTLEGEVIKVEAIQVQ